MSTKLYNNHLKQKSESEMLLLSQMESYVHQASLSVVVYNVVCCFLIIDVTDSLNGEDFWVFFEK